MGEKIYNKLNSLGTLYLHQLMPRMLQEKLRKYGFEERSTLIDFIGQFCIPFHDRRILNGIFNKPEGCLTNHHNGIDYFIDLRCVVLSVLDFLEIRTLRVYKAREH